MTPEAKWTFQSVPKVTLSGRTCTFEETYARVAPLLRKVPITRITDVTPLDVIGLPVFSAVTPLARDLTVHMGKGTTAMAARCSAVMEAIERVSGEEPHGPVLRASFDELRRGAEVAVLDPHDLDLPDDTAYRPDRVIEWTRAHDLISGDPVLVPVDVVINPPREGVLHDVDTNGLASGNSLLEAVIHGICEVIERDCVSQHYFCTLFSDPRQARLDITGVRLDSLPSLALAWVEETRRAGLDFAVYDLTGDLGVPTFRAYAIDHDFPVLDGTETIAFGGLGTNPNADIAVMRAVTEAIQSRLGTIQGARESHNDTRVGTRTDTWWAQLRALTPSRWVSFSELPSYPSADLLVDLRFLLDRLSRSGLTRCLVADLTNPQLGVPVVRVRVPGLSEFAVNMRRLGMRCLRHLL